MEETRPKVLALYEAVLRLLDEGADINAMKVSDITERAEIGKGTAYEYFKKKEEIIASALVYDMSTKIQTALEELLKCESFAEKIASIFRWIRCQHGEHQSFARFLRLCTQHCEVNEVLFQELQKKQKEQGGEPILVIEGLCREAQKAGELRADIPAKAAALRVMADLAAFLIYLERHEEACELSPEWMEKFLCEGLLKSLSE